MSSCTAFTRLHLAEESSSEERQFHLFCNYLSLGQWELARLCLRALKSTSFNQDRLRDVLSGLLANPSEASQVWQSVATPCHLSWLCLVEWLSLYPDDKALAAAVQPRLEFVLLLQSADIELSKAVYTELTVYHETLLSVVGLARDGASPGGSPSALSSEAITVIKHLLHCQLNLGSSLVDCLSFRHTCRQGPVKTLLSSAQQQIFENDQVLQGIYMQCISERLALLTRLSQEADADDAEIDRVSNSIYGFLSRMDPSPEMISLPLDALFSDLLLASVPTPDVISSSKHLSRNNLYSCLLGRNEPFLIDRFCKVEDHMLITKALPDFDAKMVASRQRRPTGGDIADNKTDRPSDLGIRPNTQSCAWHRRFFAAFQDGEHFLEALLKLSLQLIREKKLGELQTLLQPPEFSLLRPLLVLLGWELCNNLEEASQLLHTLWVDMDNENMPAHLEQACQRLAYQVHLVEWCRSRAKSEHTVQRGSNQAIDLFEGFQSHSVLFVLHASTSLSGLDPEEVTDMLQHRPLFSVGSTSSVGRASTSSGGSVSSPFSRTFSLPQSCSSSLGSPAGVGHSRFPPVLSRSTSVSAAATALSLQQERDIAIYHSFCAVQDFMSILATCLDPYSLPQDLLQRRRELQRCTQLMHSPESGGFDAASFVTAKLAHAKDCLASTFPLNYRLEVLENIFSLLFLQYSDVYSMAKAESTSSAAESDPQPTATESRVGTAAATLAEGTDNISSCAVPIPSRMFIATESVVRQALSVLKDCLINLTSAKFAQLSSFPTHSRSDSSSANQDDNLVQSSVDMSNLQARITRLDQSIQEAKWRLALVASSPAGESSDVPLAPSQVLYSSSDESTESEAAGSSSDSDSKSSGGEVRRPQRKRRRQRTTPSGSRRGTPTSATGSRESTPTAEEKNARAARKDSSHKMVRRSRRKSVSTRGRHRQGSNIIPQMLSTPVCLLHSCLKRRRFERAREVIKMFKLEGEPCAGQVKFAERFLAVGDKLFSVSSRSSLVSHKAFAMCGVAATLSTNKSSSPTVTTRNRHASMAVSELLSSSAMPKSLYLDSCLKLAGSRGHWLEALSACLPSMVVFDLIATCPSEQSVSLQLLTMALERFHASSKELRRLASLGTNAERASHPMFATSAAVGSGRVQNPADLMQRWLPLVSKDTYFNMSSLLPPNPDDTGSGFAGVRCLVKALASQSLNHFLVGGIHQLSGPQHLAYMKDMEKRWMAWCCLASASEEHGHLTLDVSEPILAEDGHNSPIREAIQGVLEAYEDSLGDQPHIHGVVRYLLYFFGHVEKLSSLLLAAQSTGGVESVDWSQQHRPVNPLAVLKESPTVTLGRLMFDKQLPPSKVEGIAVDLGLDLVQIIMQCCCPPIPASGAVLSPVPITAASSTRAMGYMGTLNSKRQEWYGEVMTPLELSASLLSRTLTLITAKARVSPDHTMDSTAAASINASAEWQEIVLLAGNLSLVELQRLSNSDERVFFFANVLNLLLAHCAITRHSVWPADGAARILLLKSASYNIGVLGAVSAFDLWHVVLRQGQPCMPYGQDVTLLLPVSLDHDDLCKEFAPVHHDPRVLFLISDCSVNSPLPKVLDGEIGLDAALSVATSTFLASTVEVFGDQVILPCQLDWFREDITANSDDAADADLIKFVQGHLLGEKFTALQNLAHLASNRTSAVSVTFSSFNWTMQYLLPSGASSTPPSSTPAELCPVDGPADVSQDVAKSILSTRYILTASAMEYLESQLPLGAALASLVCPRSLLTAPSGTGGRGDVDEEEDTNEDLTASIMAHVASLGGRFATSSRHTPSSDTSSTASPASPHEEQPLLEKLASSEELEGVLQQLHPNFDPLRQFLSLRTNPLPASHVFDCTSVNKFIRMLQSILLSPRHSSGSECALQVIRNFYLRRSSWHDTIRLVDSELCLLPGGIACDVPDMWLEAAAIACSHSNIAAETIAKGKLAASLDQPQSWQYVFRIRSVDIFVRAVLRHLYDWPIEVALLALYQCLERMDRPHPFLDGIERLYSRILVYQKVRLCALQNASGNALGELLAQTPDAPYYQGGVLGDSQWMSWRNWTAVQVASEERPEVVVQFLLKSGEFKLVEVWARLHKVPEELQKAIHHRYILSLLQGNDMNLTKAYRALESLHEKQLALDVCETVRPLLTELPSTIFVIQYQLNCLDKLLSASAREKLIQLCLGAQALLCLPGHARSQYERLMAHPQLLIEQLLMNMKVDWAEQVGMSFRRAAGQYSDSQRPGAIPEDSDESGNEDVDEEIASAFSKPRNSEPEVSAQFVSEIQRTFDDLVSSYAEKALEFPSSYVPPLVDASSRSASVSSLHGDNSFLVSDRSFVNRTPTRPLQNTESPTIGQRTMTPLRPPSRTSPGVKRNLHVADSMGASVRPSNSSTSARAWTGKDKAKEEKAAVFQPPLLVPTKDEWVKDESVPSCMVCQTERFSMFNRRHHCRRCGRVVCQTCSMKRLVVEGCGSSAVRVCDQCHTRMTDEPTPSGSVPASFSGNITPVALDEPFNAEALRKLRPSATGMALPLHDDDQTWELNPEDEMANVQVIDEFYYDQSPSVGLCLSILALHSSARRRGLLLLTFAENMSNHMRPVAPGVQNEEVDHYLVISMMQKLLQNAKMEFVKAGDMTSIERCDTYLGYAELLRMLVAEHYKDIPSLQDLANQDTARMLRNKLLEDDRPELAVEVSTKCNLDTQSVWLAWAKACFMSGQYVAAREKLSHCWKPRVGKMPVSGHQQALLNNIVDYIETGTVVPQCSASELLSLNPEEVLSQPVGLHTHLDSVRFAECLHYLHQYGTPLQLLQFLQRHNMLNKACALVLDKELAEEVFIDGLAEPCLRRGTLRDLLDQMLSLDTSLKQWEVYLMALCRYLSGKRLHSSLYYLQLFMRDYVRAAMTCIKFFSGQIGTPAVTYKEMHARLPWLNRAREHFRSAIDKGNWSESVTVSTPGWQMVGTKANASESSQFGASMSFSSHTGPRTSIYDMAQDNDASLLDTSSIAQQVQSRKTMQPAEITRHMNTIKLQIEVVEFLHSLQSAAGSSAASSAGGSTGRRPLPTLFNRSTVREDLAAQIASMDPNLDDGFKLAQKIVQDFRLNNNRILSLTAQRIAKQHEWKKLDALFRNMQSTGMTSGRTRDEVVMTAIKVIVKDPSEGKQVEKLVGMLQSCDSKVSALVDSGKLKNAYLVAVKAQRVDLVRTISLVAKETNQPAISRVCEQFLTQVRAGPK